MNLGLKAGGFDGVGFYTQQPGNIAFLGYTTAQPLMDQIKRLTGPVAFFKNFVEIAFLAIAVAAIVAAFCVITIQVVLALVTFKFGSLAAFVLVPFGILALLSRGRGMGWGDVKLAAPATLSVRIEGSGDVSVLGTPKHVSSEIDGSGSIRRL